jgi:hypothetical protein
MLTYTKIKIISITKENNKNTVVHDSLRKGPVGLQKNSIPDLKDKRKAAQSQNSVTGCSIQGNARLTLTAAP